MARVTDELLPHESDGIQEYDNPLPRWWLLLFYGTILWTVLYLFYYHVMSDWSSAQRYEDEMAQAEAKYGKREAPTGESLAAAIGDAARVERGKELFATMCASCHKPDGTGLIGPNLTDDKWLHGYSPEALVEVITVGVPSKGMVAWGQQLGPEKILDAAAFVTSLGGVARARLANAPQVDSTADHSGHPVCVKALETQAVAPPVPVTPPEAPAAPPAAPTGP